MLYLNTQLGNLEGISNFLGIKFSFDNQCYVRFRGNSLASFNDQTIGKC